MHSCCDRVREQAIQGLSDSDLDQLNSTCEQIRKNLDQESSEASQKQNAQANCKQLCEDTSAPSEDTKYGS